MRGRRLPHAAVCRTPGPRRHLPRHGLQQRIPAQRHHHRNGSKQFVKWIHVSFPSASRFSPSSSCRRWWRQHVPAFRRRQSVQCGLDLEFNCIRIRKRDLGIQFCGFAVGLLRTSAVLRILRIRKCEWNPNLTRNRRRTVIWVQSLRLGSKYGRRHHRHFPSIVIRVPRGQRHQGPSLTPRLSALRQSKSFRHFH